MNYGVRCNARVCAQMMCSARYDRNRPTYNHKVCEAPVQRQIAGGIQDLTDPIESNPYNQEIDERYQHDSKAEIAHMNLNSGLFCEKHLGIETHI